MKLIIAYISPQALNQVKKELYKESINRFSIADAFGHSDHEGYSHNYRGIEMSVDLMKKIRVEIAVNDDFTKTAVDAIMNGCKTSKNLGGKIFVLPIEQTYRISTGESGSQAIG